MNDFESYVSGVVAEEQRLMGDVNRAMIEALAVITVFLLTRWLGRRLGHRAPSELGTVCATISFYVTWIVLCIY